MNKEAYLVTEVRTAIVNFGGTLAPVRTDDLAAVAIEGLLKKVPSLDLSAIKDGAGDLYIAGGVENMTRGPWVLSKSSAPFGRDQELFDSSFGWRFINPKMQELYGTDSMGNTAENLAEMYSINREDQDRFALWSQQKATKAQTAGILGNEIVPVMIPRKKQDPLMFDKDEFMRPQTTMEGLGGLRAAFKKDGTVTAGNASMVVCGRMN